MGTELRLFWGLICHGWGDFLLQSSWMAKNKYDRWWPAIAHAAVYTTCFLPLTQDIRELAIIGGTHLLIDHYRVAGLWARLVNSEWQKPQPVIPPGIMIVIDQIMHMTINSLVLK